MTDNILNSASFDDVEKSFKLSVQPFIREGGGVMELGGMHNVFWIKHIGWRYKYIDVGIPNAVPDPRIKPIEVSVENILTDASRALPPFTEPKPVIGRVRFKVINTNLHNNHRLDVEFMLNGVLVSPKPGKEPLELKVQKGYVMMDSTARGELAMREAAADKLDETLVQLGLGSLRESLPGGLAALKELPPAIQTGIIQGLVAKGELPEFMAPLTAIPALGGRSAAGPTPLALPEIDSAKESSAFIGDFIAACPDELQEVLRRDQLRKLAEAMVEKGWRRV